MGTLSLPWFARAALPLMTLGMLALAACSQTATPAAESTPAPIPTLRVSLLVQVSEDDIRWFRDVEVPKGTDAYELTELVTEGNLDATYYPLFRSHFINGLLGVEGKDPKYWLLFVWDEGQAQWAPLPVGADLYSLKEGHVLAWAYTDTSLGPEQVPSASP